MVFIIILFRCADGKWNIPEIFIKVPDLNKLPGYMSNKTDEKLEIVATASSNDFSDEAGTLKGKGVAVKRSYFCSNLITGNSKTCNLRLFIKNIINIISLILL